jgi:lipoprotein-anchoring transpeptidase ErfK/SrfK
MFVRWIVALALCAFASTSARAQGPNGYSVEIDLEQQVAYLIYFNEVVLTSPISSGRQGFQTKRGRFKVIQKERNHYSNLYGKIVDARGRTIVADADSDMRVPRGAKFVAAPMPYFIRFNGAEGLHAGHLPGYPASHGCVRLPERNAVAFFNAVQVGTPVTVFGSTPTRGRGRQQPDYWQRRGPDRYEDEEEYLDPYDDEVYAPPPVRWR